MRKRNHVFALCNHSFSNTRKWSRHIESVHEKKKPHKCQLYDHNCSQKNNLNAHIGSVHEKSHTGPKFFRKKRFE